jgi:cell shape-determining protein MreD
LRLVAQIVLGSALIVVLAALWPSAPRARPDIVALIAVYLGLTAQNRLAPSVAAAVVLGYCADLLFGSPTGLLSFVAGATCVMGHLIQRRLVVRGAVETVLVSAITGFLSSVLTVALLSSLESAVTIAGELYTVACVAFWTGIAGPLVFLWCRLIDRQATRGRNSSDSLLEGLFP